MSVLGNLHDVNREFHHYEHSNTYQNKFAKHVQDLITEFERLGNPFLPQDEPELIQLGTRDVMDEDAVAAVRKMEATGVTQFEQFRNLRIVKKVMSIHDTISKNNLRTFKTCNTKGQGKSKSQTNELKMHIRLFSQMYISTQVRGGAGDMEEFFKHETLKYPPALTKDGEMRSGNKAD